MPDPGMRLKNVSKLPYCARFPKPCALLNLHLYRAYSKREHSKVNFLIIK